MAPRPWRSSGNLINEGVGEDAVLYVNQAVAQLENFHQARPSSVSILSDSITRSPRCEEREPSSRVAAIHQLDVPTRQRPNYVQRATGAPRHGRHAHFAAPDLLQG